MTVSERTVRLVIYEAAAHCAICRRHLLAPGTKTDDPSIIGEICHVVPARPAGPRAHGRAGMQQPEIDSLGNLLLLCAIHHKIVDDQENTYTIERLREIKRTHAGWVATLGAPDRLSSSGQATKVSVWPALVRSDPAGPTSAPAWGAHIRNGSDLPVYQLWAEFRPVGTHGFARTVIFELIPPGDWHVSGRYVYVAPERPIEPAQAIALPDRDFTLSTSFTDTNGRHWRRGSTGILTPLERRGH
jgi:hypothetical protein